MINNLESKNFIFIMIWINILKRGILMINEIEKKKLCKIQNINQEILMGYHRLEIQQEILMIILEEAHQKIKIKWTVLVLHLLNP